MINATKITDWMLIQSLTSTVCPACGGAKVSRQTLCRRDYFRLPHAMRKATYDRLGEGYKEAVIGALNFLGATEFHEPDDLPRPGRASLFSPHPTTGN